MPASWPPIRPLLATFLGRPYGPQECWRLVCELMHAGGFLDVATDPLEAIEQVQEVWFVGDHRDPLTLVQPWDWWLLRKFGPAVGHIGMVVDGAHLVHAGRPVGVCLEPLKRWRPRLVQIARLRCLL